MLSIYDHNQQLIKQWTVATPIQIVDFIVHNTELLSFHSNHNSITLFYGFLDQEYPQKTPAEFVSELVYEQGISKLDQCYGSFIILHLDIKTQCLYFANDAMGDFAAHFYQDEASLKLSDLPDVLLNTDNKAINEERLLHYFALTKPQTTACFYKHIKQLKPGQYIIFDKINSKCKIVQYYNAPEKVIFKQASIDDLSVKFVDLMQTIINFQSQGQSNIGVMMSGGLDSTFVAANGVKTNKTISAFSYVFPNYPEANENLWIDAMRHQNINMHTFSGEPYWPLKSPFYISLNSPISNPYRPIKDVIYKQVQHKNIKFLFSGMFADHLYTGYIYWLVDQMKSNPLKAMHSLIKMIRQHGIIKGLKQIAPSKWTNSYKLNAPWMHPMALKKHQNNFQKTQGNNHSHPQQFALAYGLESAQSNWLDNEYSNKHNIFVRHPFRDRRMVEFLMALPAWILGTINQPKAFVRHAAKDLLPETIIRRQTITSLKPLFIRGVLNKEINKVIKLLNQDNCSWQNYIDEKRITKLLQFPNNAHNESDLVILWQCISYELWQSRLRQL